MKFVKAYIHEPLGILLKVAKKCKSENLVFYYPYGAINFYVLFWQLCFQLPKNCRRRRRIFNCSPTNREWADFAKISADSPFNYDLSNDTTFIQIQHTEQYFCKQTFFL